MEVFMMRYTWATLCISILVMSGLSLAVPGGNNETAIPVKYELTMDITNQIYNNSLLNPSSFNYQMLFTQVKGALYSIYGCSTCNTRTFYQGISAMTFSNQTETVLVKATLVFHSNQMNTDVIKHLFMEAVSGSNNINSLTINPEFTQVVSGPTPSTTSPTNATATTPPTNTTTSHPSTHPTNTTTTHPNTTKITHPPTTTHPTTTTTTKTTTFRSGHHNAASSFFHQSPITLTSFLRFSVSFFLFFHISYSF